MLVANMVFFGLFLYNMLCGVWAANKGDPIVAEQNRKKQKVVVKMFFVIGITWISEIVSVVLSWNDNHHKLYKVDFIFTLINSLQGVIMFCAIYFDSARVKKIWNKLKIK